MGHQGIQIEFLILVVSKQFWDGIYTFPTCNLAKIPNKDVVLDMKRYFNQYLLNK